VRVVHLSTYEATGGAARATLRLHRGLRGIGVDSRLLVRFGGEAEGVTPVEPRALRALGPLLRKLDRLPLLARGVRPAAPFTPAVVPGPVPARVRALAPDVVQLHWIADGFLRVEALPTLPGPLVWTLHDSWAFTGGCHVPQSCTRYRERCGRCPQLASTRDDDLSRRIWERKRRSWAAASLRLVAPSRWLAACAGASALLGAVRCDVIPNGLDLERFRPRDPAACRDRLGLPRDRRILLTGGVNVLTDPNKGVDLLREALRRLPDLGPVDDLECVVVGAPAGARLTDVPVPTRALGTVSDEETLAELYAAADVFVAPSRQENLPSMAMETMACGVPCVAFDAGGFPDLIEHQGSGWLAPPYDAAELARGVAWVLADPLRRRTLGERGRRRAEATFEQGMVARRYAALYAEVMDARPSRTP
jgi:glycosyltransferase involved in cell wall biosynthesis